MPQVINTNVASLNAQRNLNKSQNTLQTSLQRLSSGLRINSAKDDAAGLAISDRMTSQIRGMNQASRNAADAISLAQTGEGALQEITNNLQRMRELAVQSRNVTNTDADRASLDAEYQQLLAEVDRIATTTAFNGRKVLDGSLGSSAFQVGANVGETISVDVSSSMRTNSIGSYAYQSFSVADSTAINNATVAGGLADLTATGNNRFGDNAADAFTVNGTNVRADIIAEAVSLTGSGTGIDAAALAAGTDASSAAAMAAGINRQSDVTGVTASVGTTEATIARTTVEAFALNDADNDTNLSYNLTINGVLAHTQNENDGVLDSAGLANAVNNVSGQTGVTATVNEVGDVVLSAADGRNVVVGESLGGTLEAGDTATGYFGGSLTQVATNESETQVFRGEITLQAAQNITLNIDDEANDVSLLTGVTDEANTLVAAGTIDATNITDEAHSDEAMLRIDQAITDVDTLRGTFGSIQSRFESTISSLQTAAENVSAARSRILDADFAQETANLTKAQILQQAGVSVLSQANALPQSVLALLQ